MVCFLPVGFGVRSLVRTKPEPFITARGITVRIWAVSTNE